MVVVVVVVANVPEVCGALVVVVEVLVEVVGRSTGAAGVVALTPGCSLATNTPIATVAAVANATAERVRRRRRASARCLAYAESDLEETLIGGVH